MRISDWSSDVCSSDLPTEYEFANKHLANWNHWKRLLANVIIRRYIDEWREELELKMKAKAVREMQALVNSENGKFKAAKYLDDKGWDKRAAGMPRSEERRVGKEGVSTGGDGGSRVT